MFMAASFSATTDEDHVPLSFDGEDGLTRLIHHLKGAGHKTLVVLCDDNTHRYCYPLVADRLPPGHATVIIPQGEASKELTNVQAVWDQLLELRAGRDAAVLNLGGGMVTDLGGFAASTFKRGIAFYQMPTTLLAMVDAAHGGKTGINYMGLKNVIGSFALPQGTLVFPDFLQTLPQRALKAGMAEMLKHGLIADRNHWNAVRNTSAQAMPQALDLIQASMHIKRHICAMDFYEQNQRKALNLGHTVAHALESCSVRHDRDPLWHGEAVAHGIRVELALAANRLLISWRDTEEIHQTLVRLYGNYTVSRSRLPELMRFMHQDKKNERGLIHCSLLQAIGDVWPSVPVHENELERALRETLLS